MPFGLVVAGVGRGLVQEGWVGVDQVLELCFLARPREVQKVKC
jgi:hypothetical protein